MKKGFTLIELLVVIAIIGVLTALLMANFGTARERARDTQRKSDLNQIKTSLALYYNIVGRYPTSSSNQIVGCGSPPTACEWGEVWKLNDGLVYMKRLPSDPLAPDSPDSEYSYTSSNGESFLIRTQLENKSDQSALESRTKCGILTGSDYVVCQD